MGDEDAAEVFVQPQLKVLQVGLGRERRDVELLERFVMPSAWVREKPRCSSFLMMLFVSTTSVCIWRQSTI